MEIQERHAAVRELERSLLDLHQVFLDMAVLVEAQGEMLDNIESQARGLAAHRLCAWICGSKGRALHKQKSICALVSKCKPSAAT